MSEPRIRIEKVLRDYAKMNPGTPWRSKCEKEAADEIKSLRQRVERLGELVGAAYQIVGTLADHGGVFDHPDVIRALDALSYQVEPDGGLLPWPRAALSPKVQEGE